MENASYQHYSSFYFHPPKRGEGFADWGCADSITLTLEVTSIWLIGKRRGKKPSSCRLDKWSFSVDVARFALILWSIACFLFPRGGGGETTQLALVSLLSWASYPHKTRQGGVEACRREGREIPWLISGYFFLTVSICAPKKKYWLM